MSDTIDETTTLDEAPPRRLVRADEGRWVGGVCAGLGRYFDVNPLVYRIAFTALAFAGGTGLLLYLAAWLVIPGERSEESVAVEALRQHRDRPWLLLGVGLLAFGAILALSEARFWPGTGNVWLAATLIGAAVVWWHVGNRDEAARAPVSEARFWPGTGNVWLAATLIGAAVVWWHVGTRDEAARARVAASPAESTTEHATESTTASATAPRAPAVPRPPRKPSLLAPVLGALLVVAGLLGLLAVLGVYVVDMAVVLAGAIVVVGAAVAAGALTGRRVGGLVVLGLLLLPAFGIAASTPVSLSSGVGSKVEHPASLNALQDSYELGIGNFTVDLSDVALQQGTTEVDVNLGIGEVVVTVPEDVALEIDARAGVGEVIVLDERDDGAGAHERVSVAGSTPDAPVLQLDADVAIGSLEVRRA